MHMIKALHLLLVCLFMNGPLLIHAGPLVSQAFPGTVASVLAPDESDTATLHADIDQDILQELREKQIRIKVLRTYLVIIIFIVAVLGLLLFFEFRSRSASAKNLVAANEKLTRKQEELAKVHEVLVENEAKYRNLVENSPTGILFLDRAGNIMEVNKRMLDILGSPGPEETKRINCLEYAPLKSIGLSCDLLLCIDTGKPMSRQVFYTTKWGKEVHLTYSITPLMKNGRVHSLILNAEDISESVRAEQLRMESELKYHILVENSLQAMLIVQGGRVIFSNSKIEELTGYPLQELRDAGRRWLNLLIHPDDKRRSFKNLRDALEGHEIDPRQVYKIVRKDGQARVMETLGAVVELNNKPAMLIVAIDITETTRAQHNLMESEKRLKELNAMKDKFFSIIAHDLKNPFSSILGFSNLLHEAYDNFTEKQRKTFIKNICEASENTFKLLQNLLEWSRTQTGKIEFLPRPLDLEALVNENISILKSGFVRKNIEIHVAIPKGTSVFADENMIKLVIRNLLSNALKFTHSGGRVDVLARSTDSEVIVTVKDNGVGIAKENLLRLFRIDDQIKTPGTAQETGSGLGLILCREFTEQNKGRIWVQSSPGEGSSFFFSLPSNNPSEIEAENS